MSTPAPAADLPEPTEWVRCLATIEPTATDRMRYEAGTEWSMPRARAEVLLEAGAIELIDPPACTRAIHIPFSQVVPTAAPAPDADEE